MARVVAVVENPRRVTKQRLEEQIEELDALRASDIARTFGLFSRARRLLLAEEAARDVREIVNETRICEWLVTTLRMDCVGLLGHGSYEVIASLSDPLPSKGMLRTHTFKVKVDGKRCFIFTLTRQSGFDGGDARDRDGFEDCWFVWTIAPEDNGGSARLQPESVFS